MATCDTPAAHHAKDHGVILANANKCVARILSYRPNGPRQMLKNCIY